MVLWLVVLVDAPCGVLGWDGGGGGGVCGGGGGGVREVEVGVCVEVEVTFALCRLNWLRLTGPKRRMCATREVEEGGVKVCWFVKLNDVRARIVVLWRLHVIVPHLSLGRA